MKLKRRLHKWQLIRLREKRMEKGKIKRKRKQKNQKRGQRRNQKKKILMIKKRKTKTFRN